MVNPQLAPDNYERRGIWSKLKDTILGPEEFDDDEQDMANAAPGTVQQKQKNASLRLQTARTTSIAVRCSAQDFEDAKKAADGLKNGEQQIVNLSKASPQMAERILDFLNGVCYALDGSVEKVGDKVFVYVPANVAIEVDKGGSHSGKRSLFAEPRE